MFRYDIINKLITDNNYTSYLEIGYGDGTNFDKISIDVAVGIDIGYGVTDKSKCFIGTSKDYFNQFNIFYDIIFIDGSHLYEDVLEDFNICFSHLNPKGTIVLHDCLPPSKDFQERQQVPSCAGWTGDVWKAIYFLRISRPDLEIQTIDTDYGCCIIKRGTQQLLKLFTNKLSYDFLYQNKQDILNLVPVNEIKENKIHILTIHHDLDNFLNVQESFINLNSKEVDVLCGYSNFDITPHKDLRKNYKFVNIDNMSKEHYDRLNYLTELLYTSNPNEDDILVFMDSDAFPISTKWVTKIKSYLEDYPIVAIQRKENMDNPMPVEYRDYPHPCFLATTIKFWKENNLNWNLDVSNGIYTPGITLKKWLDKKQIKWKPLNRTNIFNTHPLMFGVYDDIIYHHGCGQRQAFDGVDIWSRPGILRGPDIDLRYPDIIEFNKEVSDSVLKYIKKNPAFINLFYLGQHPC